MTLRQRPRSLRALDQFHLIALGRVDEADHRPAPGQRRPVAQLITLRLRRRRERDEILHLEREMHQIRLHRHARRARRHLADFDFLVAVRRRNESELRAARRSVAACDLEPERVFVKRHRACQIVDPHPGVQKFFDHIMT